jgi:hypothetical protein
MRIGYQLARLAQAKLAQPGANAAALATEFLGKVGDARALL